VSTDADFVVHLHDGLHSYVEPNPVFALARVRTIGEAAVVADRQGRMSLLAAPAWDAARLREEVQFEVVGCDDVAIELASRIRGRVTVAGLDDVNSRFRAALADCELIEIASDGDWPKSTQELVAARRASAIAEQAYAETLATLAPGIAEHELVARLDVLVRTLGADDHFLLCSSSPEGDNVRAPTGRTLEPGDVVNIEISPSVDGQFVQVCRTAVLGRASERRRSDYRLIVVALRDGMAAARPGATVSDVVAALDAPLVSAGLGSYCRPPHIRVRGHGQGIASLAPGDITFDNDTSLVEGMMFTLHPNQRFPHSGYMMCGEPIVVTPAGGIALTSREPGLDEC
jgi:Xaa-Pro dipeptidase